MFAEENEVSLKSNGGTEITKRSLAQYFDPDLTQHFQIIPSRVREIQEDKIRIYWAHDLPGDPECDKAMNQRDNFHLMVFSSNWQLQQFLAHYKFPMDSRVAVIETPIEPLHPKKAFGDKINLTYFSTPQRGLRLLVDVFEKLAEQRTDIHLNVFSSFKIYGWEDPEMYEKIFERIRQHDSMTYFGSVPQSALRDHLENEAHILAYPSIWPETSCRVLMESMSAGLWCVHPNLAALADTSGGLTSQYQFTIDEDEHKKIFAEYLLHAINVVKDPPAQGYLKFVKSYADTRFDLPRIASQWTHTLETLLKKYPTIESRKHAGPMFIYKAR